MICLSKNLTDEYINAYAKGAGLSVYDYDHDTKGKSVLIRSLAKRKFIWECERIGQTYYYMDSGYIGNYKSELNPFGWKLYHRIVKNGLQHSNIIERPSDRWEALKYKIEKRKKGGRHILLVLPSEKPCKFYGIDIDEWKDKTIAQLQLYTDRPIKIREKQNRFTRLRNTIFDDLQNAHALVTYQSIAAVESVLFGVPAFTLAPTAADPVANKNLANIEKPEKFDKDYIYSWACHLAYGQFHINELKDGTAHRIILGDNNGKA